MKAIWKGSISFGLVTIPISVMSATSKREKISFKMLRKGDLSPIRYKRVAETDGKEVAWGEIVKGYEYEKGQYVVFEEKDFDAVEIKSSDTIEIQEFVDLNEINPIFFNTPYYLAPLKGGGGTYALLRDVLKQTGKVGIGKVTMKSREHLAALKANGDLLVMELMHFAEEVQPTETIDLGEDKRFGNREIEMAKSLVEQMTGEWEPEKYHDEYETALQKLIDQKIKAGGKELPGTKHQSPASTNVIDLAQVLQQSLAEAGKKPKKPTKPKKARTGGNSKAA